MPRCYGVPKPNQRSGAHPMIPMDLELVEAGIHVYSCHVCARFLLIWPDELDAYLERGISV